MRTPNPRKRPVDNPPPRPRGRPKAGPRANPVENPLKHSLEDPLDNPLYTTTIADMERYLQEHPYIPAHSIASRTAHERNTIASQRLSGNGIKRGRNEDIMEEFDKLNTTLSDTVDEMGGFGSMLAEESEEGLTAEKVANEAAVGPQIYERQLANEQAAKLWREEKMRRRRGLLGVPAADARIGTLPEPLKEDSRKDQAAETENEEEDDDDDADREWLDHGGKDTSLLIDGKREWEVKAIIDAKLMRHKTRKYEPKDVCYKVTYKGNWPKWNATPPWQVKEDLVHCAELVRKFHRDHPEKPGAHRAYTFGLEAAEVTKKEQRASKEAIKNAAELADQIDNSVQDEETPDELKIIAISSGSSSSPDITDSVGPTLVRREPSIHMPYGPMPRSPHAPGGPNAPFRPMKSHRSPLNITLAPGTSRRVLDERYPDDEVGIPRKMGKVEVAVPKREGKKADSPQITKRKAGQLVRPKNVKSYKKAKVGTGRTGRERGETAVARNFEEALDEVVDVGDIDIDEMDF